MKQTLTTLLITLLLACGYLRSVCQKLPEVTPPTPNAASLFKYQDYPVNYSTGLPSISIPLYEIRSGDISVPITLNYHSSGRKVYDETGAIGLGWTLNAGGMISRTAYGEADDNDNHIKFPTPWKKQADIDPTSAAGADFLEGVLTTSYPIPWYDTEYDYFSYSANGISGKFVLRDDNNVKIPVLIPKKPYKVEYHTATVQSNINYFDYINIIDDKGTLYRFGKSIKDGTEYHETSYGSAIGKTAWMLTEIISADKVDTISFKYQHFVKTRRTISQQTVVTDRRGDCLYDQGMNAPVGDYAEDDDLGTAQDQTYGIQRLIEIKYRNGKVSFNLQSSADLVTSLEVLNSQGERIQRVEFDQSTQDNLSDGNAPTKKLNSATFLDNDNLPSEKYQFEYYPTSYNNSSVVDVRFRDLWGYYNLSGQLMMRPVIENIACGDFVGTDYITIGDPGSIRTPNLLGKISGVLKKITFPTGGSKEFVYEHNKYWDEGSSQAKECGGLRLLETITDDGSGNTLRKSFKYGVGESGYGILPFVPSVSNMSFETIYLNYYVNHTTWPDIHYRQRTYNADVLPIFGEFHNRPVFYAEVTEYHGTLSNNTGKTIYKYDQGNVFSVPNSVQGLFANNDLKHWKENSLIEKIDFKNENSSYLRVKKTTNTYQETTYSEEKVWGLHAGRYFLKTPLYVIDGATGQTVPSYRYVSTCGPDNLDVFRFSDYTISVGKKELIRTIDSLFFDNGSSVATITNYSYNNKHLLASSSVLTSSNDTLTTESKYPFDFLSDPIYVEMESRNMLNYGIEESKYRNSMFLSSQQTQYRNWGNNIIKPDTLFFKKGTASNEPRVFFHSYDQSGNVASVSKDATPKISYIYGHRGEFVLAEVQNASPNEIFHTSFEEVDGNSVDGDFKTGRKSGTGGFSKTLTGLTNGTYKLSYFQKQSGTWKLMETNNISVASGTYSINITGQVDEIRFCPQAAFMKTYTYIPLKGILSITDENNVTTYYEYDKLNRLSIIKDDEGNIMNRHTYHYKGQ